jgi:histidinol dehydrogenase
MSLVPSIRNAGSVFLGPWSPVTAGDYASGTNHTLPTGGEAARMSGLSLESFQTVVSFQSLTADGLSRLRPTLQALGTAEGLPAHVAAVEERF